MHPNQCAVTLAAGGINDFVHRNKNRAKQVVSHGSAKPRSGEFGMFGWYLTFWYLLV